MRTAPEKEACLTETMSKARVSERSDLNTGQPGDRRCDMPMDIAMEMTTAVTPTAVETAGTTIFQLMERNENGIRRRRSQAPATPAIGRAAWRERCDNKHKS